MDSAHEELLPLSRRLDWRFLFPDPTLKRVAYVGASDSELSLALQRFSHQIITDYTTACDLAVLVNPSTGDFQHALNNASAFYVELYRPGWQTRLIQLSAPGSYLAKAEKHGFTAQAYWHYPNFENANRIIPLSVTAPLLNVLAKDTPDFKARLKINGMETLLKTGLLARGVSCISIVGHKS